MNKFTFLALFGNAVTKKSSFVNLRGKKLSHKRNLGHDEPFEPELVMETTAWDEDMWAIEVPMDWNMTMDDMDWTM